MMTVDEAIRSRKSVRRFLPAPVSAATVREIIELAARAPSGHNIQPWRVYGVAGEPRERLCGDILRAAREEPEKHRPEYEYYPSQWHEPYIGRRRELGHGLYAALGIAHGDRLAREQQMQRNYVFFDAPAGLFVTMDRRLNTGSYIDLGMFLQNLLLAARGRGLHTCGQAAFCWYHRIVRRHLPMADEELLVCGVALGYEDPAAPENRLNTRRVPLEEYVSLRGFG